ncbi:MAG: Fic family protein [Bifidobacteriaceae bacterium]|jgi:Fic family protein|nr:Fic family protein [Bifidobacteriaceae bacterium]
MFDPFYSLTPKLLASISLIERARGRVNAARLTADQAASLRQQAEVDMAVASAGLSDISLERPQIEAILAGEPVHAAQRAITEVCNAREGMRWGLARELDPEPITLEDIRELHGIFAKDLVPDVHLGAFRPGPALIGDQFAGSDWGRYKAPPAAVIEARMEALLRWLATAGADPHPVIAAGIVHQEIASIRPFNTATGQIARLTSRVVLGQHGYSFQDGLALGLFYLDNRSAYYTALDNGASYLERAHNSRNTWLSFYLRGLQNEVDRLTAIFAALEVDGQTAPAWPSMRRDEAALLAFADHYGSFSLHDAQSILSPTPKRLVSRRVEAMVKAGHLIKDGAAEPARYQPAASPPPTA